MLVLSCNIKPLPATPNRSKIYDTIHESKILDRKNIPLCVDLDGTVCATDTLQEAVFALIKKRPSTILAMFLWILRGIPEFKKQVAVRITVEPASLPFRDSVIAFVRSERERGRKCFLVTASRQEIGERFAKHLGCFDEVMGSTDKLNLKGPKKADALVARFGEKSFDYVGDHVVDTHVWKHAAGSYVIATSMSLVAAAEKLGNVVQVFEVPRMNLNSLRKAVRAHQWAKNVLVFAPAFLGHRFFETAVLVKSIAAFAGFSLAASSIYIVNDLFDLEADRAHPTKRHRPFASGAIPAFHGVMLSIALLVMSLIVSTILGTGFVAIIGSYLLLTTAYTFWLKSVVIADVMMLACLYTVRLMAGSVATQVVVSPWLLSLSTFFFLSLAFMKRVSELKLVLKKHHIENRGTTIDDLIVKGRDYQTGDLHLITSLGSASGYISVLVFCLYITSTSVQTMYSEPDYLWFACPLLLFWLSRAWMITNRGAMHSDPVAFALTDRTSYIVGALLVFVTMLAMTNPLGISWRH